MAHKTVYFEFEADSNPAQPGIVEIDLEPLFSINHYLSLGAWLFQLEYILFTERLKNRSDKFFIQSPQILSPLKTPSVLALVNKPQNQSFFIFSPNEQSKRFQRKISLQTSKLQLQCCTLGTSPQKTHKDILEADLKVLVSIAIPYGSLETA